MYINTLHLVTFRLQGLHSTRRTRTTGNLADESDLWYSQVLECARSVDACTSICGRRQRAHQAQQRDGDDRHVRRLVDVLVALADEQRQLQVAGDVHLLLPDQPRHVAHAVVRVLPVQARQEPLQLRDSINAVRK